MKIMYLYIRFFIRFDTLNFDHPNLRYDFLFFRDWPNR